MKFHRIVLLRVESINSLFDFYEENIMNCENNSCAITTIFV